MTGHVDTLIQDLVDRLLAADPVLATGLGSADGMDRLPDLSAHGIAARVAAVRELLPELEAAAEGDDVASAVDAAIGVSVARRVVREYERRRVQHTLPNAYLSATYGILLVMIKELAGPRERVEAVAGRLDALPGLLEEARANLVGPVSRVCVENAIDHALGVRELVAVAVLEFAREMASEGDLDRSAERALAAVEAFTVFLREQLLPVAVDECGCGRDLLVEILRDEHLLSETPEQIAAVGRAAIDETAAAMAELAERMGHASAAEAVAAVSTDHPARDALASAYREALAAARRYVVDNDLVTLPEGERLVVEATPGFLRSSTPFAAYEGPGPYDRVLEGFYWVTPPPPGLAADELERALSGHPFASMPTVGVHEGYPGHHTQFVRAAAAPTPARRIAHIPDGGMLMAEGWAFYCEEMMEREGFLAEPDVRLMRLNDQLWRACRVVIDMELNLGLMSFSDAVDLLARHAHLNRPQAELEVRWYVEAPGYPMSYLVGKREIVALAADYAAGRSTSLKTFHDELLDWGATAPALIRWGMGLGPRPF